MKFSSETTKSRDRTALMAVWLTYIVLLASFNLIYARFFPINGIYLGHDYSFMFPAWLDGLIWFQKNGLEIPWFSPSFCAGQPFFADPQSSFYSIPQFINFVISPLNTAFLTLLLTASSMYWGGYLLMRKVFLINSTIGILVGGLLMLNGFLPHRILIGHITFHGFALVPFISLLLLVPLRNRYNSAMAAITAGIMLAYWVHAGFGTLIIAGVLSIFAIALLMGLQGNSLASFFRRSAVAAAIALCLSIAKLWAAFSFLSSFPRTDYLIPGAASLTDALIVIGSGLFLPPSWSFSIGASRLTNTQWVLGPHEWAYNFGLIIALLGSVLIVNSIRTLASGFTVTWRQGILFSLLLICLGCPFALNVYEPAWNEFLKTVPIIKATTAPIRWIIVYIPIVAILIGLMLSRSTLHKFSTPITAACLLATIIQIAIEPRDFYLTQSYDSRPISIADSMLRTGKFIPGIRSLGTTVDVTISSIELSLKRNDTFFAGISQVFCYNPIFGYRLENFRAIDLKPGPVLEATDGYLNLKNPACYVYPKENECKPGDRFKETQIEDAKAFIDYRPFPFKISAGQAMSNQISYSTMIFVLILIMLWFFAYLSDLIREFFKGRRLRYDE